MLVVTWETAKIYHKHHEINNASKKFSFSLQDPTQHTDQVLWVNTGSYPRPNLEGNEEFQWPITLISKWKSTEVSILKHVGVVTEVWDPPGGRGEMAYATETGNDFSLAMTPDTSEITMQLLNFSQIAENYGKSLHCWHTTEQSTVQEVAASQSFSLLAWLCEAGKYYLLCYSKAFLQCELSSVEWINQMAS